MLPTQRAIVVGWPLCLSWVVGEGQEESSQWASKTHSQLKTGSWKRVWIRGSSEDLTFLLDDTSNHQGYFYSSKLLGSSAYRLAYIKQEVFSGVTLLEAIRDVVRSRDALYAFQEGEQWAMDTRIFPQPATRLTSMGAIKLLALLLLLPYTRVSVKALAHSLLLQNCC